MTRVASFSPAERDEHSRLINCQAGPRAAAEEWVAGKEGAAPVSGEAAAWVAGLG